VCPLSFSGSTPLEPADRNPANWIIIFFLVMNPCHLSLVCSGLFVVSLPEPWPRIRGFLHTQRFFGKRDQGFRNPVPDRMGFALSSPEREVEFVPGAAVLGVCPEPLSAGADLVSNSYDTTSFGILC
jgi:hypothetical protein